MQELRPVNQYDVLDMRKRLGMTQAEFAKAVDAGLSTVKAWEGGTRVPPSTLRLVCAARAAGIEPW